MNGMTMSAQQQRIDRACGVNHPRYLHKPTGRRYVLVLEAGGACELEGLDGRSTYAQRADLDNAETWERLT